MTHEIPEHIKNSELIFCIDEFVRNERDREILKYKWFNGYTIEKLSDKYNLSETKIKSIVYDIGDEILLKACELNNEK